MMSSTAGAGEEDFPPNPFRSTMTGEVPPQQPSPQHQYQQQQQGDFFQPYGGAVTDPLGLQQQQQGMMMQQQSSYPPNAMYPVQQQQQYPQQQYPQQQQPMMSMYPTQQQPPYPLQQIMPPNQSYPVAGGPMDNKMEASNNASSATAGAGTTMPARLGGPMSWMASCLACCTVDTYKSYFDLDTDDVKNRVKAAILTFYKADYFRNEVLGVGPRTETLKGPDLYGPFWITMTLIFLVAVVSNLEDYIHRDKIQEFDYDMNHLVRASSILLFFVFAVPSIFWLLTQCLAMQALYMVEWICIYGYSMVIYMPAILLCLIPLDLVAWIVLSVATAVSALLVVRNVSTALLASDAVGHAKASPLILAILGTHAIFLLVLKLTFFQHHRH